MKPIVGHVIRPGIGEARHLPTGPQRILWINERSNVIWLIRVPGRSAKHVATPQCYPAKDISEALERDLLIMEDVPLPARWQLSDADFLDEAATARERALRQKRLNKRDKRYEVVEAIVGSNTVKELLATKSVLRKEIFAQAAIHHVNVQTIYSWLHRYWAGRECLNSLLPEWGNCGNPGKQKVSNSKRLGRKSRLYKHGIVDSPGYVLTDIDRQRLALGYSLVKPGLTVHDAFLKTCAVFWSLTVEDQNDCKSIPLLPTHLRPTQSQFEYWGRKLYGNPMRRAILGLDKWNTSTLAVSGSSQDQVHAVGQMAMIDSTSTDVYLTSCYSRTTVLPPMHRTVVKDVRSTLIMGWYIGWESPSSETSLQAILCAAGNKVELAAQFGIAIGDDDMPGMLHKIYLADNGEMKSNAMIEAERNFRFGIEFVKAYSGQSKSQIESQHHADHKSLDHKLPGTTHGRQRKRGEKHPALKALWNYSEYMREFILGVIAYNNEEVPDLAPTDMKMAGVPPTRLNVFKWLRDHHMRADLPCDLSHLRAFALPDRSAVMCRDGIHLLMDDGIRRLPGNRYYASALENDHRWRRASANQSSVPINVKFDGVNLSHVWFATSEGLLKIPNVLADIHAQNETVLADFVKHVLDEDLRTDQKRQSDEQKALDTIVRREGTTQNAAKEKASELRLMSKKPSKKEQTDDLRKNTAKELEHKRSTEGRNALESPIGAEHATELLPPSMADLAMDAFLERLGQ